MNDKESFSYKIVDAVVSCCATDIGNGISSVTTEEVLSKSRSENVVLTRQIVAMQLSYVGYTKTTIAQILQCSPVNVRKLIRDGFSNLAINRAFQLAHAEATIRCRDIL